MAVRNRRDPWRPIWQIATSDGTLAIVSLVIAAALTATALLPQMSIDNPSVYAKQLSEAQSRFGEATPAMEQLGLFGITRSIGFRSLLALLAGCLLLRLIEGSDRMRQSRGLTEPEEPWREVVDERLLDAVASARLRHHRVRGEPPTLQIDRWPWADLFPLLVHAGGLLLLTGLLVTHLWGWQVEGVIAQSGGHTWLPGGQRWVALGDDGESLTRSPGVRTFVEERGPGVRITATDDSGNPLPLQQTLDAPRATALTVALAEDPYLATREAHIAIPEAQLIVRLIPELSSDVKAEGPVLVEVYRSPSGELAVEAVLDGEAELTIDDARLVLAISPYVRLTATYNPGLWPTALGVLFLTGGLLGSVVWPTRRLWLRQGDGVIEGTGDLSTNVTEGEED
jgi:hypothetical protein